MNRTETILPTTEGNGQRRRPSNGRFGASGAVRCRKNWYNFCKEFLYRNGVEAPPAPSRWDVIRQSGASAVRNGKELKTLC